jgi:hypothetical protein
LPALSWQCQNAGLINFPNCFSEGCCNHNFKSLREFQSFSIRYLVRFWPYKVKDRGRGADKIRKKIGRRVVSYHRHNAMRISPLAVPQALPSFSIPNKICLVCLFLLHNSGLLFAYSHLASLLSFTLSRQFHPHSSGRQPDSLILV